MPWGTTRFKIHRSMSNVARRVAQMDAHDPPNNLFSHFPAWVSSSQCPPQKRSSYHHRLPEPHAVSLHGGRLHGCPFV